MVEIVKIHPEGGGNKKTAAVCTPLNR